MDAHGLPVRVIITKGTESDFNQAVPLISGYSPNHIIADKGYDSDAIVQQVEAQGAIAVIPPKSNRKSKREYDAYLYKIRHLVENAFLKLNRWRGIATRYAKKTSSFLAIVQIRCMILWCEVI